MRITTGERVMGVLGYLFFLFIIPVKVRRDSMFIQFHARQGGVLFVTWLIITVVLMFIMLFLPDPPIDDPSGGWQAFVQQIFMGIIMVGTILYILLMLTGIFKVLMGERYRMPVIADIALMLRL